MQPLIGRETEKKLLNEAMQSGSPELIALFGRRRVGKTFLIRQHLAKSIVFEFVGSRDVSLSVQLSNFSKAIGQVSGKPKLFRAPENWEDAFDLLTHFLTPKLAAARCVVFLDEFPWLSTPRSGFLPAFDHWWNSWGNKQTNLVVVICGSAASWMIQHVVNNRGGLHNRITRRIRLLPFNLGETEALLKARHVNMDRYQILQLYMVMGGIPHYLNEVKKGESATQAIDRICFSKDGLLANEFTNLYHSLFEDASRHLAVVRALASNNAGLTRKEIILEADFTSGGRVNQLLQELIESGFVMPWQPYDKKSKDIIYKLADEFTHFYLKFLERNRTHGEGAWQHAATGQSWKSWSGVAFERVCLKHIQAIRKALGILNVYTEVSVWKHQDETGKGAQVDLLLDRSDFVVNLCEIKYAASVFTIDKSYADELENKRTVFKKQTKTNKSVYISFVTTFGIKDNDYAKQKVQNSITMDTLFEVVVQ